MSLRAIIWIPKSMDESCIERLKQGFDKKLNKELDYEIIIDNDLIGGFIAHINGKVYDSSFSTRLNDMRTHLL